MKTLHRLGAVAAFLEAAIYVSMFGFYGAYWNYPATGTAVEKLNYLTDHLAVLYGVNVMGFIVFGIALAALVLAVHDRLSPEAPQLMRAASMFGVIWVTLVMAAGMIANVGLMTTVDRLSGDPERALTLFSTLNHVVEGLGGGNEMAGGLWVLLLSLAALRGGLPKALAYFGLGVGAAGMATTIPAEAIKETFGLTQIVWFIWLGCVLLRAPDTQTRPR
ncbi:DUF4386 family protein [Inhella gelatinilytica]|uniref:DUF4386 family protein n=1 Tax=Inhella gelatinilytica TaxID=2795030 RepID=A0A931NDK1_9BURK|nr:DUF4386 family protein [Inhella gelatinilytica]MBH9552320.1 DUF4386 family protein [Inhella gelatinilytica]